MKTLNVKAFGEHIESALKKYELSCQTQIIIHSPKSFKANYHLGENLFLAVRYNARNGRTDFALIRNKERIFGYDNLKNRHYHPFENPSNHIFCDEPTIDQIISEVKAVLDKIQF